MADLLDSSLGLADHHKQLVVDYLRLARFRRTQCVKTIDLAFEDLAGSRLVEGTFTCEEVREMLSGLSGVVRADVESELITTAHTNALLLREVFADAEKWHLKLQADINQLETRELLDSIARFEHRELTSISSSAQPLSLPHKHSQLEPLNTAGGDKLLHLEINRLKDENRKLQERVHTLESKASSALSEKDRLKSDLAKAMSEEAVPTTTAGTSEEEVAALREKIANLEVQLTQQTPSSGDVTGIQEELATTKHEMLKVTAELERTKEELERKFADTVQFKNMKQMLASKNQQLSELRAKLSRYES